MIEAVVEFFRANWVFVSIGAVFAGAVAKWVVDIHNAEKLRLEIQKLRQELEQSNRLVIPTATLDEILEYANRNPNPSKIRRFLDLKMKEATSLSEAEYLPTLQATQYAQALERVEIDIHGLLYGLHATTHIISVVAMAGVLFERTWHDWPLFASLSALAYFVVLAWVWTSMRRRK
jgi:hypothetical protein